MTSPNGTTAGTGAGQEASGTGATLKRAFLAVDRLQRELDAERARHAEPVAVIGLGCRFPGGVVDADSYWQLLSDKVDAVREIPADRWDADAFYDEQPQRPGRMSAKWGGFLDRIDAFDHDFFGISRREAVAMDPQQRLVLQVAWEALEDAGLPATGLAGSDTGVFLGVCSNDFATETFREPADVTAYASTGTAHSVVTGRLSYLLDLRGPSVAIDSACSSSLVAVHQAVQALRSGECDLALGGGVNVVMSPLPSIAFSQFPGMVSRDGRCKTFDATANGYVRSEGCGVVVLKRLSDARRDGDRILALIRGGAVNQDGRSSGVTAPNGAAQRDVLRRAVAAAGVAASEVGYVEAHGTGTRLGDPIEVEALADVYGRPDGAPVFLGSSKTNLGHLEAAAGIAGLIKTVLALSRGRIPANVHFQSLNPHISFDGTTFAVPAQASGWAAPAGQRFAGVSSFGFSGTNAHLVLQDPPLEDAPTAPTAPVAPPPARPESVLALSAKDPAALTDLARRYADRLDTAAQLPVDDAAAALADLCFSANTGRSHFRHRLGVHGRDPRQVADRLRAVAAGEPVDGAALGEATGGEVVFLFTGQGPQRVGMARTLFDTQPTFRRSLEQCDEILRPLLETPLLSVLYPQQPAGDPATELIYRTSYSQPALFAVEYALAQLWRSWGIEPAAVLGHSFGEYVAACVAGAISLEDGLRLIARRGELMELTATTGAMAAVFAGEFEVAEEVCEYPDLVSIAAVNGPANTVVSGDRETVAGLCETFERRGVRTKQLRIGTSSHSPLIEPILPALREACSQVTFSPPVVPLVSNLDGELWAWDTAPTPDYWVQHARRPVRFAAGIATLRRLGYGTFVEVGPAPTLLGLIGDGLPAVGDRLLLPTLRPQVDDWQVLADSVAQLYAHGADVDWRAFDGDTARRKVPLPSYPFRPTSCRPQRPWRLTDADPGAAARDGARPDSDGDPGADSALLYRLDWQPAEPRPAEPRPAEPEPGTGAAGPGAWLLLADDTGIAEALAERLASRGEPHAVARRGECYAYDGTGIATVRPDDSGDLRRLIADLAGGDDPGPAGPAEVAVLHLWSLDAATQQDSPADAVLAGQRTGCLTAVHAATALAATDPAIGARLWLLTRGAVATGSSDSTGTGPVDVGAATLWGLGRSLQQELPARWGGLVDLEPTAAPQRQADAVLDQVRAQTAARVANAPVEDQLALRDGNWLVARLVRATDTDTAADDTATGPAPGQPRGVGRPLRRDAGYLITGGLGGLGLHTARSLVQAGARHLILAGRTALPPRGQWGRLPADHPLADRVAAVRELEALGASVLVEQLDVADADAVTALLHRWDDEGRPAVRGVVHAAGTGDVAPITDVDQALLERDLLPKAIGGWNLHRAFAGRELDFFVLYSSASALLSSPFVAGYAAANAFLDALAQSRRAQGLPALSIDWGIWEATGLASRGAEATPGLSRGMGTLQPGQAIRVLHRLLAGDLAGGDQGSVAVVPVDWPQWGCRYQEVSGSRLLARLLAPGAPTATARPAGRHSSLLPTAAQLLDVPAAERAALLRDRLLRSVAGTLGTDPGGLRSDQALFDLGLDSLMAVELRNDVDGRLGVTLPISLLLQGVSVDGVTDHLLAELAARGTDPATPPDADAAAPDDAEAAPVTPSADGLAEQLLAELEALSENEARGLIGSED